MALLTQGENYSRDRGICNMNQRKELVEEAKKWGLEALANLKEWDKNGSSVYLARAQDAFQEAQKRTLSAGCWKP